MNWYSANEAYIDCIRDVLSFGKPVEPQLSTGAQGRVSFEIMAHAFSFNMQYPLVTVKPNTSWLYMCAEPMWVLDGSNKLDWSDEVARIQRPYSDDGFTLAGAYGPAFHQQVFYVVEKLKTDSNSRQAVMTIWKRTPVPAKDIPCLVSLQFLVRNEQIHVIVNMRSSDVGMGLPYDMLTFTCMAAEVAQRLGMSLELGTCYITAGSRHIYQDQIDAMSALSSNSALVTEEYEPWNMWKWLSIKETMLSAGKVKHSENTREALQAMAKRMLLTATDASIVHKGV